MMRMAELPKRSVDKRQTHGRFFLIGASLSVFIISPKQKMKTPESSEPLFLGLDSSTQSLKGTLVDRQCRVRFETVISFDADLPLFQTQGGAHRHPDGLTVTSPTLVWVAALDLLLSRMKDAHAPFGRVKAVSGSGQQHGSIYWRQGARDLLRRLDPRQPLEASLASAFAMPNSPIWMDSSTGAQCRQRDDALGGPRPWPI